MHFGGESLHFYGRRLEARLFFKKSLVGGRGRWQWGASVARRWKPWQTLPHLWKWDRSKNARRELSTAAVSMKIPTGIPMGHGYGYEDCDQSQWNYGILREFCEITCNRFKHGKCCKRCLNFAKSPFFIYCNCNYFFLYLAVARTLSVRERSLLSIRSW